MHRIMLIDDEPGIVKALRRLLHNTPVTCNGTHYPLHIEAYTAPLDALARLDEVRFDLLLADYRMPEMSGLEFLEQAMDLFPHARRALLTAYADTDAAIQAINVIDLDHYLLKPWDPPAEKLYPVVDELIELWRTAGDKPVTATQVVGHRWSARSYEVRDFLARNSVSYRWLNADEPEGRGLLAAAGLDETSIPLVVTPEGDSLVNPGVEELAARVGLSTTPATDFYDTVIVGGGPAGLGAAVYAASEGLRTVMVERRATGGQAGQSSRIENYLGFPDGVSGAQLTDRARRQASKFGAEILAAADVTGLEARGSSRVVRFADGGEVAAHTVVLATGVSYHTLEAPGVDELTGRGIFYGSAATEAPTCAGQDVYVVGGANSAGQAAVFLARHARQVTMLVRADGLERSMSHYLIRQIRDTGNIQVRPNTSLVGASGTDHLERLRLLDTSDRTVEEVKAGYLFVFIGAAPCTEWLDGVVERDRKGFVVTGPDLLAGGRRPRGWPLDRDPYYLEASVPGVFAAGDARANSVKRVASAVGEGAMAIQLVHRYLEAQ
jgi:thioredoxin reductase (NADPH)